MADDNKGVKPPVAAQPDATKPVDTTKVEPTGGVKPDVVNTPERQPVVGVDLIPRDRFNEVNEEAKRYKEELEELRNKQAQPPLPAVPQVSEIDHLAEEMSRMGEVDEFGNPHITPQQAKAMLRMQMKLNEVSMSGLRMRDNVAKFVKRTTDAVQYADTIESELGKLPPGVRDNPANVEKMYYELIGRDVAKAKLDAYNKGRQDGMENKRIATNATVDTTGIATDAPKTVELSDTEKVAARKLGVTEEAYLKSKQKGLEQRGRK